MQQTPIRHVNLEIYHNEEKLNSKDISKDCKKRIKKILALNNKKFIKLSKEEKGEEEKIEKPEMNETEQNFTINVEIASMEAKGGKGN